MTKAIAYNAQRTNRVTGIYYGVPFSGVITETPYWLPDDSDTVVLNIKLDSSILVFNRERTSIQMRYSTKLDNECYIDNIK